MNSLKKLRALAIISLGLAVTLVTVAASAANDDVIVSANLAGPAINGMTPHGVAQHVTQPDGDRKLEVEVEDVSLPAGTVLEVFVNSARIGSLTLNSLKQGEIQLETERGQAVPAIASGTTVDVRTQAGLLVVSGAFGAASPTPSPSPNPQDEVLFRASLSGPAIDGEIPHGSAKHVTKANGDREIEVEVEDVNLPANTVLNVFVKGTNIGSLVINSFQRGELEFETEDGHAVPAVSAGTTVDVRTKTGVVIVSGVFGAVAPPPPGVTPTPEDEKAVIQFGQVSFTVSEGAASLTVPVTRTGNLSHDSKIDFRSVDGSAVERSDFTTAAGRLFFGPGESTKNITVLLTEDSFVEGNETFSLMLFDPRRDSIGNPGVAQITITDNDTSSTVANPVDVTRSFLVQHYMDFLNREPEPGGLQAWQDILNQCAAGDDRCDRIEVSSAFFRSPEFQDRGYFLYRFYSAALGRIPHYAEFEKDMSRTSGFQSESEQEANKALFSDDFVARQEFRDRFDQFTQPADFVDALQNVAGVNVANRDALIAGLQSGQITRAQVLRSISESPEVRGKFYDEAFVVMQYFGYLRRDPDILYLNWIQTMKSTGDYRTMINGFMNSSEYRERFGR